MRKRHLAGPLTGALVIATVLLTAGPATATTDEAARVQEFVEVGMGYGLTFDPVTREVVPTAASGSYRVVDADGKVKHQESLSVSWQEHHAGIKQVGDYTCVVSNKGRPYLQIVQPRYATLQRNSVFFQYVFHMYIIDYARDIIGVGPTRQINNCTTGGGDVWNDYRQWFNGATTRDSESVRRMIGTSWPTAVVNGVVSSSLNFQVGQAPVQVGGSVNVQPQDRYGGNTGPNPEMDPYIGWNDFPEWNVNRVNAYYIGPHTFIWDGSPDFQGNTHQGLYEYPIAGSPPGYWGYFEGHSLIKALCGRLSHDCAPFL